MAIWHRFLLLIHVLHCIAIIRGILLNVNDIETCNVLCRQCNASVTFENGQCECIFTDNEDLECIQHIQQEIQPIDLNALSDNLIGEERNARSILKSRRRLKTGDAVKVAQYFINGGPLAGHSHFLKEFILSGIPNSVDSATNSFSGVIAESKPENEFHDAQPCTPSTTSISGNTYDPQFYMKPEAAADSVIPGLNDPITGSLAAYPTGGLHHLLHYPYHHLGSLTYPYNIHHGLPLHPVLHSATLPRHTLHNIFAHHPHYFPPHLPMHHYSLPTVPFVGQYKNSEDSTASTDCPSTNNNNVNEPMKNNVANIYTAGSADAAQYSIPYINTLHQPLQYTHLSSPFQYHTYQSPGLDLHHSPYAQSHPYYLHGPLNPILPSIQNPNSYYANNANTERPNTLSIIIDDTVGSSKREEVEKTDNVINDIDPIKKEESAMKDECQE